MSSSLHFDNKGKYISVLGIGPTQELNDTTFAAEDQYSINFSKTNKILFLSLHYNGSNNF